MEIRKIVMEDMDLLIEIRMDYLFAEKNISSTEEIEDIKEKLREYFSKHLNTGFIAVIAEDEGKVLSAAFMSIVERPPLIAFSSYRVGTVYNVYTYPQYRGKGIAKKVMSILLAEAKLMDVVAADLNATDKGRGLYESLGFKSSSYTSMSKFLK